MKLDKKQLPQLVVLGVLLIGCIGFISFQMKSRCPAPAPAQAIEKKTAAAPVVQEHAGDLMSGMVFSNLDSLVPRRDPFAAVGTKLTPPERIAPKPNFSQPRSTSKFSGSNRFTASNTTVPPISLGSLDVVKKPNVDETSTPEVQEPEFTLTGIIRGADNVAIVRSASGRYVVKQGALIEGRYRVISISQDSIMLDNDGRLFRIKLGGVKNAS